MKVVSYARVSTLKQESEGESLDNQERAVTRWLDRTGHQRIGSYIDAASGKDYIGRAEFSRMIADLPKLKPDAVVIETLDRFTRNLRDGLNLLEELRGHGVGLIPLDWRRERPIDIDNDDDWRDVVDEFTDAEKERRRIRRRVSRSYEGRRERGATTVNTPAYGLRKDGDRLVPTDDAWIVRELDTRFLAGTTIADLARWTRAVAPEAWRSIAGVRSALANAHYVSAGIRDVETHAKIASKLQLRAERFNQERVHEHEFSGVFVCGPCIEAGREPRVSLMNELWSKKQAPQIRCQRRRSDPTKPEHVFNVAIHKIEAFWRAYIAELATDEAWLKRWAATESGDLRDRQMQLERGLAKLDQDAAALKKRRDRAFDLAEDSSAAVARQARRMLAEIDTDEMQLEVRRQALLTELAQSPAPRRDPEAMRAALQRYVQIYEGEPLRSRNELNRALCKAIGSHPVVYRVGKSNRWRDNLLVVWPELDELRPLKTPQPFRPASRSSRGT